MNLTSDIYSMCIKATTHFEQEHASTITDYDFKIRDLILIQNTAIEKSFNCKMHTRYIGPLIVILQNRGGMYIILELDGSVFDCPISTFHVIPYFVQEHINIPPLKDLIDISLHWLCELEETMLSDPDDEDKDLATDHHPSSDVDNDDEDWGQSTFQLGGEILVKFFIFCTFAPLHLCSFSQLSFCFFAAATA